MARHVTRLGRRWLSAAVAMSGALTVLAGCSSEEESTGAATSISLVASFSGEGESPAQQMAQAYEKETGVHIEVRNVPPDSYDQVVRTELQGGSGADIIGATPGALFPTSVGPLVAAGMLAPITDPAVAKGILPGSEHLYTYDGKVYAAPTSIVATGLVVNDQALRSAGVTSVPATFEGLLDSCESTTGDTALVGIAGSNPSSTAVLVAELAANYVYAKDRDWNQKRAAGEVTFADSEGWQQVFEAIEDMVSAGCFQDGAAGVGFDQLITDLVSGSTATVPVPSLAAASIKRAVPNVTVSIHAFPPVERTTGLLIAGPSFGYAINAAAKPSHQEAAQRFASWVADPANAEIVAEAEGGVPLSVVNGDASKVPDYYAPIADAIVAGDMMYLPSYDWDNPEVAAAMGTGVQSLMTGQGTGKEALQAMDAAWQSA